MIFHIARLLHNDLPTKGADSMQIKHLEYFVQVVECGSISKAANALYLKPSNLSKCINSIENEFAAVLFDRSSKGVTLTTDGEKVLAWAKNLLDEQQKLKRCFERNRQNAAQTKGNIVLAIPATINEDLHAEPLNEFIQQHPRMSLTVEEMNISDTIDSIRSAAADIAVLIMNGTTLRQVERYEDVIFIATSKPKLVAYAAKESDFAQKYHSISIKTLQTLPIILYTPASTRVSTISELLADHDVLHVANQTSNAMLFHSMLGTGKYIGIGIDALSGMDSYTAIPIRDKLELHTGLLFKREALNDPLLKLFISFYLNYQHVPIPDYLAN